MKGTWHRGTERAKLLRKTVLTDLLKAGLPQAFNFENAPSAVE